MIWGEKLDRTDNGMNGYMSQFQYEVLSARFFLPTIELMLSRLLDLPVWSLEKSYSL